MCPTFFNLSLLPFLAVGAGLSSEFIVPPGTFSANHASTIIQLKSDKLLVCWFAGSKEAASDVEIVCSEKSFFDAKWSKPRAVVKQREWASGSWVTNKFVGNPVLLGDDEGKLWMFYEAVQWGGHSGAYIDYKISQDEGQTWSSSQRLVGAFGNFGHLTRNPALRIGENRFLLPVYREFTRKYGYVFDLTLTNGSISKKKTYAIPGSGHIQPALVRQSENCVRAYSRNTESSDILTSTLDLTTMKWSNVRPINLPNPHASVAVFRDEEGTIFLVYNHSRSRRSPLVLSASKDGERFSRIWDFETETGEFSYPSIIQTREKTYELTYTFNRETIKHVRFTSQWLARLVANHFGK